jgi:hypothetical protein
VRYIVERIGTSSWVSGATLEELRERWGLTDRQIEAVYRGAIQVMTRELAIDGRGAIAARLLRLADAAAADLQYEVTRKCLADVAVLYRLRQDLTALLSEMPDDRLEAAVAMAEHAVSGGGVH